MSYFEYSYSGTNPFTLFLQVFFDEGGHTVFLFGVLQDLDVVSQANVESSHTLDLIDFGVEVPDVVVALVGLDCLHGNSLSQPHAEETIIDDVTAVVLVNQLLVG